MNSFSRFVAITVTAISFTSCSSAGSSTPTTATSPDSPVTATAATALAASALAAIGSPDGVRLEPVDIDDCCFVADTYLYRKAAAGTTPVTQEAVDKIRAWLDAAGATSDSGCDLAEVLTEPVASVGDGECGWHTNDDNAELTDTVAFTRVDAHGAHVDVEVSRTSADAGTLDISVTGSMIGAAG